MSALAWGLVMLWGLVLLASARPTLARLPAPGEAPPVYGLWLPEGGAAPALDPPPSCVHLGLEPPPDGPQRWLVLGAGVECEPELPRRLAACDAPFVSVFPRPLGGTLDLAVERLLRDLANPAAVNQPRSPAAFADARCAWLLREDLSLPGVGRCPVLRVARARKAHGLPVTLLDPRPEGAAAAAVSAPARTVAWARARADELLTHDVVVRALVGGVPAALCWPPLLLLVPEASRVPAALALGLGVAARLMTATRDGFGGGLPLVGPFIEPMVAWHVRGGPRPLSPPMPRVPDGAPPPLTAAHGARGGAWLDAAAIPFLARRLGGSAVVMEQIYQNTPTGLGRLGQTIDGWVNAADAARAVRHRRWLVARMGRALSPSRLLSVPCGGAGDAAAIAAPRTVLADPDPAARSAAIAACPLAEVVDATVERAPRGPFDVVLYIGLLEYLDDAEVVQHLVSLRSRVAPGGALITSTTADSLERSRMERWLGWSTRPRTPEALTALLDSAGYRVEVRRVDPTGRQCVVQCRARPEEAPDGAAT